MSCACISVAGPHTTAHLPHHAMVRRCAPNVLDTLSCTWVDAPGASSHHVPGQEHRLPFGAGLPPGLIGLPRQIWAGRLRAGMLPRAG